MFKIARFAGGTFFAVAVLGALASSACLIQPRSSMNRGGGGGAPDPVWWTAAPWQTIERADAHLRFEMPGAPGEETEAARQADGRRVTRTFGSTRTLGVLFGYAVVNFELGLGGSLLSQLDSLVDGFIEGADGSEIVAAEAIWHHGYPGTELRVNTAGEATTSTIRHYVGRSRAYIFFVSAPQGQEDFARPAIEKFFGSIRFDPTDAPSVDGDGTFSHDAPTWVWITPPEAGFAIEVPGAPRRSEIEVRADDHDFTTYLYTLADRTRNVEIEISTVLFGSRRPDDVMEALEARLVEGGGRTTATMHGARGGHAMRRLEIAVGTDRTRHAMIVLGVAAAHVVSITFANSDSTTITPTRDRLFDSFIRP